MDIHHIHLFFLLILNYHCGLLAWVYFFFAFPHEITCSETRSPPCLKFPLARVSGRTNQLSDRGSYWTMELTTGGSQVPHLPPTMMKEESSWAEAEPTRSQGRGPPALKHGIDKLGDSSFRVSGQIYVSCSSYLGLHHLHIS